MGVLFNDSSCFSLCPYFSVVFQFQDNGVNMGDSEVYIISETQETVEVVVERLGYKQSAVEVGKSAIIISRFEARFEPPSTK